MDKERLLRRLLVEELIHLRRRLCPRRALVHPIHPRRKRLHPILVKRRLRIRRLHRSVQVVIAPAHAREITRLLHQLRKRHHVRRQRGREAPHPNRHRHPARHNRRSRRHALRRRREHAVAAQPVFSKLVQHRRAHRIPIATHVRIAMIVTQHQQHVRPLRLRLHRQQRRRSK